MKQSGCLSKKNEGESWFQDYMEFKFRWGKVIFGMNIKFKKTGICHAYSKRSLKTTYNTRLGIQCQTPI